MSRRNKVSFNIAVLLMMLQAAALVVFCRWYFLDSSCSSAPDKGRVHVLLLSSWRSGSSFLGQVFSEHPSVFYLMEPAWHVWTRMKEPGMGDLRMAVRDLVRSVFRCDFSVMDAYLPANHYGSSLFNWARSRALCLPPACSIRTANESQCRQSCHSQSMEKVEEACRSYSHVVLKEVRFFDLESLYPLFQDPSLDLRIIHLVRDPRAVMRSREEAAPLLGRDSAIVLDDRNVPADEVQYRVMQEICRSHIRIYKAGMLKPPPFLNGRYKVIRYEDLARNPIKEVKDIYKFVSLEMTINMEAWISRMTHGKGKGTWQQAFQIVSRNAVEVSQAWRTMLPHEKVKQIQEICKGAMSLLGYKTVDSEEEQKRLDLDLLEPHRL